MGTLILSTLAALTGIYISAEKKITLSKKREIARPRLTYVGVAFMLLAIFSFFVNLYAVIGIFILILIVAYLLGQRRRDISDENDSYPDTNLIILLMAIVAFKFLILT